MADLGRAAACTRPLVGLRPVSLGFPTRLPVMVLRCAVSRAVADDVICLILRPRACGKVERSRTPRGFSHFRGSRGGGPCSEAAEPRPAHTFDPRARTVPVVR